MPFLLDCLRYFAAGSVISLPPKALRNIDILLGLFSSNHNPFTSYFLSKREPQIEISISYSNITETLHLSVWGPNFTAKQIQDLLQLSTQHGLLSPMNVIHSYLGPQAKIHVF